MDQKVGRKPCTPILVYDGECGFCRRWIERWEALTGDRVNYVPHQDVAGFYPEIPRERFERAVQFIETDGSVYEGAEAVCHCLGYSILGKIPLRLYTRVPGLLRVAEWCYGVGARHRMGLSRLGVLLSGRYRGPRTYTITRAVYLRLLGAVYLVAFVSLWTQVEGLVGENGILPAPAYLEAVKAQHPDDAGSRLPTLLWLDPSDRGLNGLCASGTALSVLMIVGIAPAPTLLMLWACYLSLLQVGQTFLSFQWDILLLEAGFISIFLAPLQWRLTLSRKSPPRRLALLLLWWLLFRLMFASGAVKLISNDDVWWNLTALEYHYWTQPLPTWLAWYAHQLPAWFQRFCVSAVYILEMVVPFLIFLTRRFRLAAFGALVFLQVIIAATGNYTYFNLLTVVLCVLLLDDAVWPRRLRERIPPADEGLVSRSWLWLFVPHAVLLTAFAVLTLWITIPMTVLTGQRLHAVWQQRRAAPGQESPRPHPQLNTDTWAWKVRGKIGSALMIGSYGLFANMTETRPEIVSEGSRDGREWKAYSFRWKPGDLKQRPGFVAPHQPRLDWQMWFAALGDYRGNPWFIAFVRRLLEGEPSVTALLAHNPFPNEPPVYIRCPRYHYTFTDRETRRRTGEWWSRAPHDLYLPGPVQIDNIPPVRRLLYGLPDAKPGD